MAGLRDWLRLARPHFLVGGFAFFALGALLARAAGHPLGWPAYALGQAFVTATQLGVHVANEVHDLPADRANEVRTRLAGGSRVLVDGRIAPARALLAARSLFLVAVALAAALGYLAGWRPGAVAAATLVLAWAYSAPPVRLCARGVGGLATGLIVAGLVPALALTLAGAPLGADAAMACLPLVALVGALVGVLSLPDAAGDAAAGKRTLVVRLGARRAGRVLQATWVLAGLATLATVGLGRPPYVAAAAGTALAVAIAFPVLAGTRRWDLLAFAAAGLAALQWLVTVAPLLP